MSKILVVEDDEFLRNAYRVKLTKAGFELQLAGDGDQALELLKSFHPDLILLDLVMPKRDGFSVLTEVKKNPSLNSIPVLVTSNLGQKEDIDRCMQLGAAGYIVKSDTPLQAIIEKIQQALAQVGSDTSGVAAVAAKVA